MDNQVKLSLSSDSPGARLFVLGNEAIARGAIEAGVQVVAAYPGTPSTEIVETLLKYRKDLESMYVEWSVNEKVAFGLAFGASLCGARGMAVMKHVGVNVALDSIMTAAYIGAKGGLVLVEAEDPGQWSSQNEQDNRYIAEQAYIPVLEPSSAQEARDMVVDAFRLSEEFGQPFMLRSVTRIGHSRSDITLGNIVKARNRIDRDLDPDKLVMLPAVARRHRRLMVERLARLKEAVNSLSWNQMKLNPGAKLGIITSGISYSYLLESLAWLNIRDKVSILKIGTPYPLPDRMVGKFLKSVPEVLIIEELEPFLETRVKALAHELGCPVKIHGKDVLPLVGEYSIRRVTEALCRIMQIDTPVDFSHLDSLVKEVEQLLPARPPTMCAGCPHRASHYVIQTVCEKIKRETGIEPIRPGDIGCNCLGVNPPLNAIDISTCMGGGFDLSNGISRVTDIPVIAHLGDSTFFHSGMAPMVNAVYNNTKITMIVLDNLTTAMTGAQPSPASKSNSAGDPVPPIRPEEIAAACGVRYVKVIDPLDLSSAIKTLEEAIRFDGPSFIVFRRPCAILDQREKRIRGEKTVPHVVRQEKCLAQSPPACTAACPLHIDVRGYVRLVREGRYDEALKLIQEKLPFPGIMGRICTRPCESRCKRGEVDDSIAIAALKRSAADYGKLDDTDLSVTVERQQKVAVIGGGPAGVMAAFDLRKKGYKVTLFEALPALGGMLYAGIPHYRLPESISQGELNRIRQMGVEIKLNTRVGLDIRLSQIRKKFDAVFIATGATMGKDPGIENSDVPGVVFGIDFLRDFNLGNKPEVKNRVAVIGGGNVAVDCARACLRAGFQEVSLVYRRDRQQMPAIPEEIIEAEKEGVKFIFLSNPRRIITQGDRITGVECLRMHLGEPDAGGRARPEPVPGSEFILETDMVIMATGEQPDLAFVDIPDLSIENDRLAVDPLTLATGVPGIFAGGDVVSGPATVVEALAAGRRAAESIDRFLSGEPLETEREPLETQPDRLIVNTSGVSEARRQEMPVLPLEFRLTSMQEVERGYSRHESEIEASRCLSCGCEICIRSLGCPAIETTGGEVTIDQSQCPGCGLCDQICPAEAIEPAGTP